MSNPWVLVTIGFVGGLLLAVAAGCVLVTLRTRRELDRLRGLLTREPTPDPAPSPAPDPLPSPAPDPAEFVITQVTDPATAPGEQEAAPRIGGRLFADLVLRESVIRVASLAYGVRRALDPETRNRIRFQVRQEVKRARRQRRADVRTAVREWEARRRSRSAEPPGESEDAA